MVETLAALAVCFLALALWPFCCGGGECICTGGSYCGSTCSDTIDVAITNILDVFPTPLCTDCATAHNGTYTIDAAGDCYYETEFTSTGRINSASSCATATKLVIRHTYTASNCKTNVKVYNGGSVATDVDSYPTPCGASGNCCNQVQTGGTPTVNSTDGACYWGGMGITVTPNPGGNCP